MTLSSSDSRWFKPSLAAAGLLAAIVLWAYLGGGIFLVAHQHRFDEATPFTLYQYWVYYGAQKSVVRWLYISGAIAFVITAAPALLLIAPAKRSLFGDARFAKRADIRKAGLLGGKGIIVGRYGKDYLMFGGSQHVIMSAPTRSGKGVGVVIPNLLSWPDSVVVLDIKQENHAITSAFRRKHGQACYLFNPAAADYRTHRYNPLAYVSDDPNFRIDDIQKIANMLFPDQQGVDPIWTATPRMLFLGIVLYLLETPGKPVTLGQVLRESLADGDGAEYFAAIIAARSAGDGAGKPLSGPCVRALNAYISIAAESTRAGILSGFRSRLELWANPLIDAATSANDFDLRDVRKKRMSIYLGATPDNLDRIAPLLNLFFQQLIDLNTRQLPEHNPALKYQCLLLPDEFTAMGKIQVLSKGISYIAGYGLRMLPIIQSPSQLVEVYGEHAADTFTTNHALQIVFPPKASESKTAQAISEWLGYQTVKGVSESKGKALFGKRDKSESVSDQRRALLLPQEITGLGKEREIVVVEDCPPILASKVRYYEDRMFIDWLKGVSPSLASLGRKMPDERQLKEAVRTGELAAPVPMIDLEAHHRAVEADTAARARGGAVVERPVTASDVVRLDKLPLSSFAVDFSAVDKPAPDELDEAALHAYADLLCREAGIAV